MDTISQLADLGGNVAIAVAFLWYMHKRDKNFSNIISNHLTHSTEALSRLLEYLKNGKRK